MKKLFILLGGKEYRVKSIDFDNNSCFYYDGTIIFGNPSFKDMEIVYLNEVEYELVLR